MNLFLNYLVVTALLALVLLPAGLGLARERRIDRQLRDAARRDAEPTETESRDAFSQEPHAVVVAQCPLLS
ncbi:hypothetical protein AB0H24_02710 [Streptomyces globisporus]|uniref:hypothetical protein n=1 Tax=Streptomyces TaxID=1883 RepID=UPI0005C86560|nr:MULTISPECIES: hypothetical protein [Streptomyces]PPA40012.1 hypothetical protein BF14_009755 [Streptomyces griseus]RAN17376.1 hypothetical protein A3838_09560 [Streptomyces badius]AWL86197.1 hypothetical protein DIJ69_09730 [Streptomyces globisporus]RAN25255.1 hypothetical protein A3800_09565 [Streptomyces badius]UIZ15321.1 hypothetical protein LZ559_24520 [Streptomyces sp. R527F]